MRVNSIFKKGVLMFVRVLICLVCLSVVADAATFRSRWVARNRTVQRSSTPSVPKTPTEIIPHPEPAWQMLNAEEKQFVAELDRLRESMNLPQIIVDEKIVDDSRKWSKHMADTGSFYHGNAYLENIAMNQGGGGYYVFRQWMNSDGHRRWLKNTTNMVCGIGFFENHWTYRAARDVEHYRESTVRKAQPSSYTARKRWFSR
jgi:uncharacterized protein YkwD